MKKLFLVSAVMAIVINGCSSDILSNFSFKQSANSQRTTWRQIQNMKVSKYPVSEEKMVYKKHLAPKAKQQLIKSKEVLIKQNGNIYVVCPFNTTSAILDDLNQIEVDYFQDETLTSDYFIVMVRNNDGYQLSPEDLRDIRLSLPNTEKR